MNIFLVILISTALMVGVMVNLAVQGRFKRYFMGLGGVVAILIGLISYSYIYTLQGGFSVSVIIRVILAVCYMFAGESDLPPATEAPIFRNEAILAIFWLGHFLAFYITASAAIEVLGRRLMQYIRIRLLHHGNLCVIYGESEGAIALARRQKKEQSVALIAEQDQKDFRGLAEDAGCAFFSGGSTLCAAPGFLKKIGYDGKGRMFKLYCVSDNAVQNMHVAEVVCKSLEEQKIDPDYTRLFLLGVPEYRAERLIANSDRYGFGSLFAYEKPELIARLLIEKAPPWTFLSYDSLARATSDFRVFIIGFGNMGHTVLRYLTVFGQMEGSTFQADVFTHDQSDMQAYMEACYPELLKHYNINFHGNDAKILYNKLSKITPCMIALCAESPVENAELAAQLNQFYSNRVHKPALAQCNTDTLIIDENEYRIENIDLIGIDRRSMILNHAYSQGPSPEEDWKNCSPLNRSSSRASADFYPAFLHAAGISRESALAGNWPPQKDILENLAKTEHLRWKAFQYSIGYRLMSDEEFESRAKIYKEEKEKGIEKEKVTVKQIGKNEVEKTHACLIPWEQLDVLSAKENAVTGNSKDYKDNDRNNIISVLTLIKSDMDAE